MACASVLESPPAVLRDADVLAGDELTSLGAVTVVSEPEAEISDETAEARVVDRVVGVATVAVDGGGVPSN